MLARCHTYTLDGITTRRVIVEVDVRPGLPSFTIVGLGDVAARELRETLRGALLNSGYEWPQRRLTVNLAPASLRRLSPSVTLAVAVAILAATEQGGYTPQSLLDLAVHGELQISGQITPMRGVYGAAIAAAEAHRSLIAPADSIFTLLRFGRIRPEKVLSLRRLADRPMLPGPRAAAAIDDARESDTPVSLHPDIVLAATVAAAGRHSLVLTGSDEDQATRVARLVQKIVPDLTAVEQQEVSLIRDAAGLRPAHTLSEPPFRVTDHRVSPGGLIAGGTPPRPGEVVLAHRGVLFMPSIERYAIPSLEALRGPLRDRSITIIRSGNGHDHACQMPCDAIVVAHHHPADAAAPTRARHLPVIRDAHLTVDLDALGDFQDAELYNPTVGRLRERVSRARARINPTVPIPIDHPSSQTLDRLLRAGAIGASQMDRIVSVTRTVAAINGTPETVTADLEVALTWQADGAQLVAQSNRLVPVECGKVALHTGL